MVRISKLSIKLLRDIKTARLQFGAVILIILLAIATFVSLYESYLNLKTSYDTTFQKLNMADYWISVDWIDQRAIREMDSIDGVSAIGRIEGEVSVDLANDRGEKVEARIISLPPENPPAINNLLIEQGAYFGTASNREVLMEQGFAKYHKFKPGDTITLKRNDTRIDFTIAGIITSPEYIWVVKSAQDVLPSARTFGILFMPQPMVESLFDMPGFYNEIILSLEPGIDHAAVMSQVKRILRQNQITRVISRDDTTDLSVRKSDILNETRSAYLTARKDQATVRLLKSDLDQFSSLAVLFPILFLFMASLTIYVLMSRMVESQRNQIGIMRAIGYSRLSVLRHYVGFGLFVGLTGSILGAIAGHLISGMFSEFYVAQLNLPYTIITAHWPTIIGGALVGTGIPLMAGIVSVWSTLGIRPAEAMRPPVPAAGNRILLRIFEVLTHRLPYILIIPFRNIVRNLRRSLFMSIGVASAVIIIVASLSFVDAMDSLLFTQYQVVQKYDARIIFQGISTASTAGRVSQFNGIASAEAVLEAPFRIKYGNKKIDTGLMGLQSHSSMFGLVTPGGKPIDVVEGVILIPSSFNNVLHMQVGDTLTLEPLVGTVGETKMKLAGFVDLPIGGKGIISLGTMQEIMRQPGGASSLLVRYDGQPSAQLMRKMYNLPDVATLEQTQDTRDYIDASMGFFWVFIGIMFLMGGMLGAAIIFNGVTVNVLQRTREIAVMRAVGMYRKTITLIVTLENLAICLLGILIGLPLGRYTAEGLMKSMSTSTEDLFSFSLVISDRTYWVAAVFAVVIILLSQLPAIRRVTNMDLTVATKENAE